MSNPMPHEFQLVGISVDGEQWAQVPDFSHLGPKDHCYVLERDDAGGSWVRFGDGLHGQRLPSGSRLIVTYRAGSREIQVIQLDRSALPTTPDLELWVAIRSRAGSLSFGNYGRAPVIPPEQPQTSRRCVFVCVVLIVLLLITLLLTQFLRP